ncbi:MAG TPA: ribonucleoside-diphosphate reductase subunit alpha [Acidimicrobiales bacterium]|nr:ribonucleoside-diphosphate reductase subunit alpha [Acidimicrobiales bacterium]
MAIVEASVGDLALDGAEGDSNVAVEDGVSSMRVRKRSGALEHVDVNKIVRAVSRCAEGLGGVDPMRVATRTISGLRDGATSIELDELSIRTAAALISEEPNYSKLAARLLSTTIDKEVRNQNIHSFSQSIAVGESVGIISAKTAELVSANRRKLDDAVCNERDRLFEFFGLRTVYDRYLLRHPELRVVIETPQYFLLRVACGLSESADEAIEFYALMSSLDYLPSSPTLFNSGTNHPQMSSCYLLDSPLDSLESIYQRYGQIAQLSKFAGGIGFGFHRVRSQGSLIRGTNGLSNGIVPWLKTLDVSVAAVNQGGRRKGAACVYVESWHADIEDFLDLRDNTGDEARRARTINLANWVPDLFMERVEQDFLWSLFDPKKVPQLCDLYGDDFRNAYLAAEHDELYERQIPARQLYARMMRTLAQTGNGWMTFKDRSNELCNQTGTGRSVVHLSNLCTEILEVTSEDETAVCNLGSVNLGHFVENGELALDRLGRAVRAAVTFLDRVIDINFYPTPEAASSNARWRPIGIGEMGLQDALFRLGLSFDSDEATTVSARFAEEIYFNALWRSTELAELSGSHPAFGETRSHGGVLQYDLWGKIPADVERWASLKERISKYGLRNSLLVAIAPTSTIASIANCYEAIEPQISNFFKRETLSGEFLQINTYLVRELQRLNMWDDDMRDAIKRAEGSIQEISRIPEDVRHLYRTAWEIPQKALIDLAAARGPFIDQSQSLNLFVESPNIGKLSSMYMYAWKQGLKTTYYLRSRPATRITKTTIAEQVSAAVSPLNGDSDLPADVAIACSLENPDHCEACE